MGGLHIDCDGGKEEAWHIMQVFSRWGQWATTFWKLAKVRAWRQGWRPRPVRGTSAWEGRPGSSRSSSLVFAAWILGNIARAYHYHVFSIIQFYSKLQFHCRGGKPKTLETKSFFPHSRTQHIYHENLMYPMFIGYLCPLTITKYFSATKEKDIKRALKEQKSLKWSTLDNFLKK